MLFFCKVYFYHTQSLRNPYVSSWTFTLCFLINTFRPFLFFFSLLPLSPQFFRGIYRLLQGFFFYQGLIMIDQCFNLWLKWKGFMYVLIAQSSIPCWFRNKLGFGKLGDQRVRETCPALDKNPLKRFEMWTHEKQSVVLHNRYHSWGWLS